MQTIDYSSFSLRSVSGLSQVSLRSVSGLFKLHLSALLAYFVIKTEPKILWLAFTRFQYLLNKISRWFLFRLQLYALCKLSACVLSSVCKLVICFQFSFCMLLVFSPCALCMLPEYILHIRIQIQIQHPDQAVRPVLIVEYSSNCSSTPTRSFEEIKCSE